MEIRLAAAVWFASLIRTLILPIVWLIRGPEYRWNTYLAEDQAWNTILAGKPDEAISARAHRSRWPLGERLINLMFNDQDHCRKAYDSEKGRRQLPAEYGA